MKRARPESGMVLLLVLFACLTVAVMVQVLCTAVLITERALVDESVGRQRLSEKDEALAVLRQRAMALWEPATHPDVLGGGGVAHGAMTGIPGAEGWVMKAEARQPSSLSVLSVSALLERARDGIDLPLAAVVATEVTVDAHREAPWLQHDGSEGADGAPGAPAVAYVQRTPEGSTVGEGCITAALDTPWRLDDGWRALFAAPPTTTPSGAGSATAPSDPGVTALPADATPVAGVTVLQGPRGRRLPVPAVGEAGASLSHPALVVVTGGADLDARDLGEFYGVLVVDDGSVLLDGTTLRGAVFAGDRLVVGATGTVVFCRSLYRWATDGSLARARLVPGSRWEGTE